MNEEIFILSMGKTIKFYSYLATNGIYVNVDPTQFETKEEKAQFEKELRSERDVISIKYN